MDEMIRHASTAGIVVKSGSKKSLKKIRIGEIKSLYLN